MAPTHETKPKNLVTGETGPGTAAQDLLPIPTDIEGITNPEKQETSAGLTGEPTLSHALAVDDHDDKGLAQQNHNEEVVDLGWNEKKHDIAAPLVGGMDNEELWLLMRRFDKVSRCL
jgi:hypothetical protein